MKKILLTLFVLSFITAFASDDNAPVTPPGQIIAAPDDGDMSGGDTPPDQAGEALPYADDFGEGNAGLRRGARRRLFESDSDSDDPGSADELESSGSESDSDEEQEAPTTVWGSLRARMSRVAAWLQNAYQRMRS